MRIHLCTVFEASVVVDIVLSRRSILQVEGRELQVLYPLLEFLHHHRLNAADPHGLSDTFAPLLMRLHSVDEIRDAEHIMEAYGLLTDLLIQRYRTLFSGETCRVV